MDLRQLRYFTHIVELGNITAAAQALYIAQPSLSQHVANLEAELDVKLLIRGSGGVRPTDAGKLLYRHAKILLRQAQEARVAIQYGQDTPSGRVTVGLPTSTSRVLSLPLIDAVAKAHPEVLVEIIEESSAKLADGVARHQIDIALAMNVQTARSSMNAQPLLTEDLLLVGHSLGKSHVSIEEVAALPLVLPSAPNSIRMLVESILSKKGLEPKLVAETSAVSVLLDLVSRRNCWTVLPLSALASSANPAYKGLTGTRIRAQGLVRQVSICIAHDAEQSIACKAVHKTLIETVENLVTTGQWTDVTLLCAEKSLGD